MKNKWQLQEAKVKFSKVINDAGENGPQYITKHGKESAVVLSIKDFRKLAEQKGSLSAFFQESPLYGIEFDRQKDKDREIKL
ncbi:MAG: type II toxin-antitoxin system Phd/YefM family antitoxin [Candidatus Marinimicrobia bacterium]|nr:type II toxin-antitoxin system Phd/YefM family antitoxin [Candidatus Neomarinimicrobiota bacterium]